MKAKMVMLVVTITLLVMLLFLYVLIYKEDISFDTIKIGKIDVGKETTTFMLSSNSSSHNFFGYKYNLENGRLTVKIYKCHFLNPFSSKSDIYITVPNSDVEKIYLQSGNEIQMIWEK